MKRRRAPRGAATATGVARPGGRTWSGTVASVVACPVVVARASPPKQPAAACAIALHAQRQRGEGGARGGEVLTERTGGRQQRQQSQATLLVVLVVEEVLVNFVWRHTTSVLHPTANCSTAAPREQRERATSDDIIYSKNKIE